MRVEFKYKVLPNSHNVECITLYNVIDIYRSVGQITFHMNNIDKDYIEERTENERCISGMVIKNT